MTLDTILASLEPKNGLLPCLFCGSKEIEQGLTEVSEGKFWYYQYCLDCQARTDDCTTKAEAITAWNTRAVDIPRLCKALGFSKKIILLAAALIGRMPVVRESGYIEWVKFEDLTDKDEPAISHIDKIIGAT